MQSDESLIGKRVLIVDDDTTYGRALCDALRSAGVVALGPSPTAFHAQCLLGNRRVDLVVLDRELYGQVPEAFAQSLRQRAIPVLLLTTDEGMDLPASLADLPCAPKPAVASETVELVQQHLSELRGEPQVSQLRPPSPARQDQTPLHRLARCIASTLERPVAT